MTPPRLSLRDAVALGLLEGPTELLPVSSSAHIALVPWLAGWRYAALDPELRKSFEVALHAGAGVALAIDMRRELLARTAQLDARRAGLIALSLAPPALAGYALQGPIERRLGGPRSIAAGLLAGAGAMAFADARARAPGRDGGAGRSARRSRARHRAGRRADPRRLAQRRDADRRARCADFAGADARTLSWHAALPVILGASALKLARAGRARAARRACAGEGRPDAHLPAAPLAAGTAAAFISTLAGARVLRSTRGGGALLPYSLYRCLFAALVLARLRAGRTANAIPFNK